MKIKITYMEGKTLSDGKELTQYNVFAGNGMVAQGDTIGEANQKLIKKIIEECEKMFYKEAPLESLSEEDRKKCKTITIEI